MSRSYRHTPICGITTAESEKLDKIIAHGQLRAAERLALDAALIDPDGVVFPELRDVSNEYAFEKDGKLWRSPDHRWPELWRK